MSPCPNCQREVAPDSSFCPTCGTPVVRGTADAGADPLIGQTVKGTYFVEGYLGGGGMGHVYRARHLTLDAPLALKILKRSLLADPSIVQRFQREARAASRLRHPNVVHVSDFGQMEDGTLFMVMEYVAGRSLARVIAEEFPLPEPRVVRIAEQILSALAEAHAAGILHRDLKPENVMLEARRHEQDLVKVLDFGIARIQLPGDQGATLTQAGLVCGTPGYMSPEQWSGDPLDARSDLYAIGCVLYELITGRLPLEARTPMEMVRKHLTEKVLPPSARREPGAVSPDLEAVVLQTLSTDRTLRPASADELRSLLLGCQLVVPAPGAGPAPRATVVLGTPSSTQQLPTPEHPASREPRPATPATVRLPTPAAVRAPTPARPTEPLREPSGIPGRRGQPRGAGPCAREPARPPGRRRSGGPARGRRRRLLADPRPGLDGSSCPRGPAPGACCEGGRPRAGAAARRRGGCARGSPGDCGPGLRRPCLGGGDADARHDGGSARRRGACGAHQARPAQAAIEDAHRDRERAGGPCAAPGACAGPPCRRAALRVAQQALRLHAAAGRRRKGHPDRQLRAAWRGGSR
ncbi:MAG: protein kinase [Anaeromyxobacter sp.]